MTLDLASLGSEAAGAAWINPARYWSQIDTATAELDPPFAVLHAGALAHNAHDLRRRAAGMPIRVASKSIRSRAVLDAVLALDGYHGILAYTLPEALWLAETFDDIVVAYPSADRGAIRQLAASDEAAARIAVMIDDVAQLDLIDAVVAPA
ncbi:MAG: amino acid deaminase/aldolase, partial [Microbacterium sp.]